MGNVAGNPDRSAQSGITLIELLAGIAVAVTLVIGTMTGVASHQAQRRMHGELILAMCACRNTMETLRSVDISQLPGYNGRGFDVPGQNGQAHGLLPVPGDADGLAGEITVVADRSNAFATLYRVKTRVRWQGVTRRGDFAMECLMGDRK